MYGHNITREDIVKVISSISDENLIEVFVQVFKIRDVRGCGYKDLFYLMMGTLYEFYPGIVTSLLEFVPKYGSWKDMFMFLERGYSIPANVIYEIASRQLVEDEKNFVEGPHSFLAKWAPREGKQFSHLAKEFAYYLVGRTNGKHSQIMASYRRRMARLNMKLETVETLECANRWDEIDFRIVPMGAMNCKRAAYANEALDGSVRKPNDRKREVCRKNFLEFKKDLEENPREHVPIQEDRYNPIRVKVKEWLEGGWRGT
ncbi:MAG: hypothetical protein EBU66_12965 [Bacteroidetes bacterium]|nr:hypothetical protein [bacterium]NBP65557.1 hypothetical protein [Bacteroidota bacterium]